MAPAWLWIKASTACTVSSARDSGTMPCTGNQRLPLCASTERSGWKG